MKKIILILCASCLYLGAVAQPKVVSHRGFYRSEGSYENTVNSLARAQKLGVAGVEFDVNMTADDSLIVFHGPKILKTGLDAQKNNYAEIRAVVLPNGHQIPSLREFLLQGKQDPNTTLVMEIKKHPTKARETQVVTAILALVKELDMPISQFQFISFSEWVLREFKRLCPEAYLMYVSSDINEKPVSYYHDLGIKCLSYNLNVMMNNPQFVSDANKCGMETTLWMSNDPEVIDWAIRHEVTYVSTDIPDVIKNYLASVKDGKCCKDGKHNCDCKKGKNHSCGNKKQGK
ncbi:MAG: glycerophosphodiester phosphodiesterase [Bacteroidales bacterium]|nr:glycerophosphodiester phosphodiesterase [Bacteroidales bacterium]